jgi:hypothetical protein
MATCDMVRLNEEGAVRIFSDMYSKALLTVIAIALSIIALNPWVAPQRAEASKHEGVVTAIFAVVDQIGKGQCQNTKIRDRKQIPAK